jgi:hypothetical protein
LGTIVSEWAAISLLSEIYSITQVGSASILAGLVAGPLVGLLLALGTAAQGTIRPIGGLRWSWKGALRGLLTFGLGAGAITAMLGLFFFLPVSDANEVTDIGRVVLVYAVDIAFLMVPVALAGAVGSGLTRNEIDERDLQRPNEGLRRSWRSAIVGGEAVGLSIAGGVIIAGGLYLTLVLDPAMRSFLTIQIITASLLTILAGVILGVVCALVFGGIAIIQNVALRRVLRQSGCIPRNFVAFLDFAYDHVLLQPVGGSYRFIHAVLADYFVSLHTSDDAQTPASGPSISPMLQKGDDVPVPTHSTREIT